MKDHRWVFLLHKFIHLRIFSSASLLFCAQIMSFNSGPWVHTTSWFFIARVIFSVLLFIVRVVKTRLLPVHKVPMTFENSILRIGTFSSYYFFCSSKLSEKKVRPKPSRETLHISFFIKVIFFSWVNCSRLIIKPDCLMRKSGCMCQA